MSVLSNLPPLHYTTHVDAGDLLQILLTQKILSTTTRLSSRRKYSAGAFNNSTWSPNILFHKQHLLHRQTPDHFSHAPRLPLLIYSDYCWSISSLLHHYFIQFHHDCIIISYYFIMIASLFHTIASFKLFNHPTPGDLYTSMTESIPLSILKQYRTEQ